MIFILFSSAYHSLSTRRGNHCFVVSYPLCFVLKSVSLSLFPMPVSYR